MRRFEFGGIKGIIDDDGTLYREVSSAGEVVSKEEVLVVRGKYKKHNVKIIRKCKTCGGATHGRATCPEKKDGAPGVGSGNGKRKKKICELHGRSHGKWPCPGRDVEDVGEKEGAVLLREGGWEALKERVLELKGEGMDSLRIAAKLGIPLKKVNQYYALNEEPPEVLPPEGEPEE